MLPGGGHLIHPGGPPMIMHPGAGSGARAQPIHVTVHTHLHVSGQEMARSSQQFALRHARRNIATGIKLANRAA